jgi:hypothetical protein
MEQKIRHFIMLCIGLFAMTHLQAQCPIPPITATLLDSCGTFFLTIDGIIENRNGPVDYIVVSSSDVSIAASSTSRLACKDTQRIFSSREPTKTLTLNCSAPTITISYRIFLGTGGICGPFVITPTITRRKIVCDPCANDTIPPTFKNCNFTFGGEKGSQIILLADSDSVALTPSLYPSVFDSCDANPTIKLVGVAVQRIGNGSILKFEAIDSSGNRSECLVRYSFLRRQCKGDSTCVIFPPSGNASDYIVVSSSEATIAQQSRLQRKVDTINLIGQVKCFANQSVTLKVFMPTKRFVDTRRGDFTLDSLIPFDPITIKPCSPCDFDAIKPFITCPNNLIVETPTNVCAAGTWTNPIVTDNCDPNPSLSSNYPNNYCFPVGRTTVIYTAKDQSNNTATCQFNVTVRVVQDLICTSYDAINTNLICGCEAQKWQPYGFYLDGGNGCAADLFKPDGALRFQINADNTATLKGNFRNNRTWELVVADIVLSGRTTTPPTGSPSLMLCQQGRSSAVANAWQYFTSMTGTLKIGTKNLTINSLGAAFQVGVGANNQNVDKMGASGRFTLSDGKTGNFGLILGNELTFACGNNGGGGTTNTSDVAVSIRSSSTTYERYTTTTFTIGAKNIGTTAMQNSVVEFRFPAGTVNGGAIRPSIGKWEEICADNAPCFKWTIPALAVGQEAILTVPLFILDVNTIVATARLLATSPTDGNATNDVATTTITRFVSPIAPLIAQKPTQLVPVVIQKLAPNPTENELLLELESLRDSEVMLNFSTPMGQVIRSEKMELAKGTNRIRLDVSEFAQGIYFVTPSTSTSRNLPIKFVKM